MILCYPSQIKDRENLKIPFIFGEEKNMQWGPWSHQTQQIKHNEREKKSCMENFGFFDK